MATAKWNGTLIAQSDETIVIEGTHYFPMDSVTDGVLSETDHTSFCNWKGTANYFSVNADGDTNENAAWIYRTPMEKAAEIAGYVAFWNGVEVDA